MKRPILILVLGYITGIILGLYCKNSVVLFYLLSPAIILFIKILIQKSKKLKRYYKTMVNEKIIIIFFLVSIISCIVVINKNNKYESIYKLETKDKFCATIISNPMQKDYYTQYKIKIDKGPKEVLNNNILLLNLREDIELEYGEKIIFLGEYISPEIRKKLQRIFI